MTEETKKKMPEDLTEVVKGIADLLLPEIKKQNDDQTFVIKRSLDNLSVNVSVMGSKVEENTQKIQEIKDDHDTLKENLRETRRDMKENRTKINQQIIENREEFDKIHSDISEIKDKMSNIWDICSQVESGKLGSYNLGADEIPTKQDMFDAKKSFMMSKHSVGLFPIWKEHVDEVRSQHNVLSDADAYRLCISQYLQCEMRFKAEYVRNIERHYVKLIYNGVDCLFIVFDDIDESGGRRIWQEARQLWPRQKGDPETDPTLKHLEAPQWRLRLQAYEMFASSLRWDWNRSNDDDFKRGIRCRTRIEFALGNVYDYVVQRQFPGERYQNVEWPAAERGQLPSIQWKSKRYRSHREIATYPKSLAAITKKDFVPPGRQIDRLTGQPREVFPIKVHTLVEGHNFVPGMVDPGSGDLITLNAASGITDGLLEIAGPRTENTQVNPISDPAYDKGTGFGIGCSMIGTSLERDEKQKERDDRKQKIAEEKKAEEKKKAEEAKAKAELEKAKKEEKKKAADRQKEIEKKQAEDAKKKKQAAGNSQQSGGFFSTFSFMGNVPATIRNILISPPKEGGAQRDEEEKMDETQSDIESDINKLERQQAELDKKTEEAEKVRYDEDKKREEEEEKKRAAEEAEKQRTEVIKGEKQKSEVNKGEESRSQKSSFSFGATPMSSLPDTILAGQPSTARPLTQLTQQNISSFFAPKKSSTLTPGHFDTENDTWGTPSQSPFDVTKLVNTNDGSPFLSKTLNFEDKDKTKEIAESSSPELSRTLEFKGDNYKLVPITPAVESEKEKIKVIPAGGNKEVEVTVNKDMGKVKTVSKLPVSKLLTKTIRKGRSLSLSENQKERKKKFEQLAKQKPGTTDSKKRTKPESAREEEASKVSRKVSPEKSKTDKVNDETKEEDITASSDDLSSISVLECGSVNKDADTDTDVVVESEVNTGDSEAVNTESKEDGDATGDTTLISDNTVIKVEVNSQVPESTQQDTQPPPQEGDEPLNEVAKEAVTDEAGAKDTAAADAGAVTTEAGVKIVMEPGLVWDKANVPSPEDKKSPGDKTGHIVGVRAHTPLLNVDSNVDTTDNSSLMKKFTKPLKLAFKEDGEKKEEDENLD